MATTNPSDKFAFLISGSAADGYLKDLQNVFDTLTKFYNYPPENIRIAVGSSDEQYTNYFINAGVPENNIYNIGDQDSYDTMTDKFDEEFIPTDSDANYSFLLYFTGRGTDEPKLIMESLGEDGDGIDGSWIEERLSYLEAGELHIVMQQDYGAEFNDYLSYDNHTATFACNTGQTRTPSTTSEESHFTTVWVKALQFKKLSEDNRYADQLSVTSGYTQNELQISMEQAYEFAKLEKEKLWSSDNSTFVFKNDIGKALYLGKPAFLIRDGDQQETIHAYYESPDIYLTHPYANPSIDDNHADKPYASKADYYIQDEGGKYDNVINVRVFNIGTHPVRKFAVGIKRFRSGCGGEGEVRTLFENVQIENPGTPGDFKPAVLCPIYFNANRIDNIPSEDWGAQQTFSYTFQFTDIRFPGETHRCIKTIAQLTELNQDDINRHWDIRVQHNEAQRNIDWFTLGIDKGEDDDQEPEAPVEAGKGNIFAYGNKIPENAEDKEKIIEMHKNIRNFKEHIYQIKNPYNNKRKFIIVFPKNYKKCSEIFQFEWFRMGKKLGKELIPLEIQNKPVPHLSFELKANESVDILLWLAKKAFVKDFKSTYELRFEILVSLRKRERKFKRIRRSIERNLHKHKRYALISGITIKIKQETTSLSGTLLNNGVPVQNAMIMLQTANGRQEAIIRTDRKGNYMFKNINPDVYKISAITKSWHTQGKLLNVTNKKNGMQFDFKNQKIIKGVRFKVILDKIRILDDKDFLQKQKFQTTIILDKNKKISKKVTIPKKRIMKLSGRFGKNDIDLGGITVFEGAATESVMVLFEKIEGKKIIKEIRKGKIRRKGQIRRKEGIEKGKIEKDMLLRNGKFKKYQRYFTGDPNKWFGNYSPKGEYINKEDMGNWQVWYRIVRA